MKIPKPPKELWLFTFFWAAIAFYGPYGLLIALGAYLMLLVTDHYCYMLFLRLIQRNAERVLRERLSKSDLDVRPDAKIEWMFQSPRPQWFGSGIYLLVMFVFGKHQVGNHDE